MMSEMPVNETRTLIMVKCAHLIDYRYSYYVLYNLIQTTKLHKNIRIRVLNVT